MTTPEEAVLDPTTENGVTFVGERKTGEKEMTNETLDVLDPTTENGVTFVPVSAAPVGADYLLRAVHRTGKTGWYSGRVGTQDHDDAFVEGAPFWWSSADAAAPRCKLLGRSSSIHGWYFTVVARAGYCRTRG